MTDRPQPPVEGWTVLTVLAYLSDLIASNDRRYEQRFDDLHVIVEHRFAAQKESVAAALIAADRAVSKAELGAEKRFESVNEFRNTLGDQQRTLMPRAETEAAMKALAKELNDVKQQVDSMRDQGVGVRGGWGYAVGAVGLIVGIIGGIMTAIALFEKIAR
jgi:hypothetical protein